MLDCIPPEIAVEILSRLPLRSILRCMGVCKSLHSLIKSPTLISAHMRRSIPSSEYRAVFQRRRQELYSFPIKKDQDLKLYSKLTLPASRAHIASYIISSCKGLVSIAFYGSDRSSPKFILWNPSIGKRLILPDLKNPTENENYGEFHGLGYESSSSSSSSTADYKLVRVVRVPQGLKVHVFSLNAGSWKTLYAIESRRKIHWICNSVFANGKIHWLTVGGNYSPEYILGFDVGNNSFFEISLPERVELLILTAYGDSSIALFRDVYACTHHEIWLMKEYGVAGSWTKVSIARQINSDGRLGRVLGFYNTKEVIVEEIPGHLLLLDWNIGRLFRSWVTVDCPYFLGDYVESLALLDKPKNVA